jgi:hypothetical protein
MGMEMDKRKVNIDQTPKMNDAGNKSGKGNEGGEKKSELKAPKTDTNEIRKQIMEKAWNNKS